MWGKTFRCFQSLFSPATSRLPPLATVWECGGQSLDGKEPVCPSHRHPVISMMDPPHEWHPWKASPVSPCPTLSHLLQEQTRDRLWT